MFALSSEKPFFFQPLSFFRFFQKFSECRLEIEVKRGERPRGKNLSGLNEFTDQIYFFFQWETEIGQGQKSEKVKGVA